MRRIVARLSNPNFRPPVAADDLDPCNHPILARQPQKASLNILSSLPAASLSP
jgi:hypothetical protein